MDISFFRRGIKLSRRPPFGPVQEVAPPKRVVLIPGYEFNGPYKQTVKVKDMVGEGEVIAVAESGDELHAPMSGEIKSTDDVLCADGRRLQGIFIEASEQDPNGPDKEAEPASQDAESMSKNLRKGGVVQSGSSPKLVSKMVEEAKDSQIEHIAVRFFDPDPYLGALEAVTAGLKDHLDDLKAGLESLEKLLGSKRVHFVLEKEQQAADIERFAGENKVTVHRINAFNYPSMTDALVAKQILGRDRGIDPNSVHTTGVLVLDISTVIAVSRVVSKGKGLTEKIISVSGGGVAKTLKVRIGTPIGDILEAAGVGSEHAKIILGGPLTGQGLHNLDYPLTKDIQGITLQSADELQLASDNQCLSCGLCNMACPMRLVPGMLSRFCEFDKFTAAAEANLFSCIECGCCAYVCPSERSMVQLFSHGKKEYLADKES